MGTTYKFEDFKSGQGFKAIIDGVRCEGKVQVEYGDIYLCQNEKNGNPCVDKLGYQYSWVITDLYTHKLEMFSTTDLVLFNDYILTPSARLEIKTDFTLEDYLRSEVDKIESMHEYSVATDSIRAMIDSFNQNKELLQREAELVRELEIVRNTLKERN